MTQTIAGADGCRAGWIVVRETVPRATISWEVVPSLQALFERADAPQLLALDIPIGLPLTGRDERMRDSCGLRMEMVA